MTVFSKVQKIGTPKKGLVCEMNEDQARVIWEDGSRTWEDVSTLIKIPFG